MENLPHYEKDIRPWGQFERFTLNEESTVKIIIINAGEKISLQTHEHRGEFWRIITGYATVTIGEVVEDAHPGDEFFIPTGTKHRIEGGEEGVVFLEIALGAFDEADITRLEDAYGRA